MSGKRAKRERQMHGLKAEIRYNKAWLEWCQKEPPTWRLISWLIWNWRMPKKKDFGLE